jgi:SAM-dependent methyltransferase
MNELWEELIEPHHKLLDVGCWNGKRILKLKDKCTVFGLDIDEFYESIIVLWTQLILNPQYSARFNS